MFGWTKVSCAICAALAPRNRIVRTRGEPHVVICRTCYEAWTAAGRLCAGCQTPVRGAQEVGVFLERRELGHADCGGVMLAG